MASPPVAGVNCAALTVMAGLVLAVLAESVRSLAVTVVVVPTVLRKSVCVVVPDTSAAGDGRNALASVEARPIVSVAELTAFQNASTALTVTGTPTPATCAPGVPVLPLAVA